jgi:hypothetical protein
MLRSLGYSRPRHVDAEVTVQYSTVDASSRTSDGVGVLEGVGDDVGVFDDVGVWLSLGTGVAREPKYSTSLGGLVVLHSPHSMFMVLSWLVALVGAARENLNW